MGFVLDLAGHFGRLGLGLVDAKPIWGTFLVGGPGHAGGLCAVVVVGAWHPQ